MADRKKEAPFLRRGGVVSRKRRRTPTARRIAVGLVALAAAFGLFRFVSGPRFALRRFEVSGNARVRTEEVLAAESAWSGRNLLALDLAPMAGRLAAHPWIERVTLSKRFPDGLSARITERRAVALYRDGEQFWWVGVDGNLIAPYDPRGDRTEYVIVTGERRVLPEAVGLLAELARGAARLRRRPLRNRLAPGRRIRYDGCDLSKAGAGASGRRSGQDSRAARGARVR